MSIEKKSGIAKNDVPEVLNVHMNESEKKLYFF